MTIPDDYFERIPTADILFDRVDFALTRHFYEDFRISYKVTDRPLFKPVIDIIVKAVGKGAAAEAYDLVVFARVLVQEGGKWKPLRRTLLMELRSDAMANPPERELRDGSPNPYAPGTPCPTCGGLGGTESADLTVSPKLADLHEELSRAVQTALVQSKNHRREQDLIAALSQAAVDSGAQVPDSVIQLAIGGLLLHRSVQNKNQASLFHLVRSWEISVRSPRTQLDGSIRVLPGWKSLCSRCGGLGKVDEPHGGGDKDVAR